MVTVKKEKITVGLLFSLPVLAVLSLCYYSSPIISRVVLLAESFVFFVLLVTNIKAVATPVRIVLIASNALSMTATLMLHSGIGCALAFFNIISAMFVFNHISLSKEQARLLHKCTFLLIAVFCISVTIKISYKSIKFADFIGNSINSNLVGLIMLAMIFHAINCLHFSRLDKKRKYIAQILTLGIGFVLITLSACRSALISLFVFAVLFFIFKKPFEYRTYKIIVVFLLLSSLLFTLVYVMLSDVLSDVVILNKKLFTGREIVWRSAFEQISEHFVFGNGTDQPLETVGGATTVSAHNTLLSLWYTLGIIPVLTTVFFFVNKGRSTVKCKSNRFSQFAFIATLFVCFFESFYTDAALQTIFILFLISNIRLEENEEQI